MKGFDAVENHTSRIEDAESDCFTNADAAASGPVPELLDEVNAEFGAAARRMTEFGGSPTLPPPSCWRRPGVVGAAASARCALFCNNGRGELDATTAVEMIRREL